MTKNQQFYAEAIELIAPLKRQYWHLDYISDNIHTLGKTERIIKTLQQSSTYLGLTSIIILTENILFKIGEIFELTQPVHANYLREDLQQLQDAIDQVR